MTLRNLSDETIRQRRQRVQDLFDLAGTADVTRITAEHLHTWQATHGGKSPQTLASYTSHVSVFFRWCVEHGWLDEDPSANLARVRVPRRYPRPISEGQLELALTTATERTRLFLLLSAFAGLRAGEIARLSRADILDYEDPPVIRVLGKGSKERIVPMGETVLHALHEWGLRPGWLFPGPVGHIIPGTVSNRVNEHLHELGFDVTLHTGRHRFLTRVYRETRDIRLTQDLAGHSSPATTAGYAAFAAERAVDAVRSLDVPSTPAPQQDPP